MKTYIKVIIVLAIIVVFFIGVYVSLLFYITEDKSIDSSTVDSIEILELAKHFTCTDWDKYEAEIPLDDFTSLFCVQLQKYLVEQDLSNIIVNDITFVDEYQQIDLTYKKGILKFPIKIDLNVTCENDFINIHIIKLKSGWIRLSPKLFLPVNSENSIEIGIEDLLPEDIPFALDEFYIKKNILIASATLDTEKVSTLIYDTVDNSVLEYSMQDGFPQLDNQTIQIETATLQNPINEYFVAYMDEVELPLGTKINSSYIDVAKETVYLEVSWMGIIFNLEIGMFFQVEENILYANITSINNMPSSIVSWIRSIMGDFQYDLKSFGMPDWADIHSLEINEDVTDVTYSLDTDMLFDTDSNDDFLETIGLNTGDIFNLNIKLEKLEDYISETEQKIVAENSLVSDINIDLYEKKAFIDANIYSIDMQVNLPYDIKGSDTQLEIIISAPEMTISGHEVPKEEMEKIIYKDISYFVELREIFPTSSPVINSIDYLDDRIDIEFIVK